jgi:hypothetical protein
MNVSTEQLLWHCQNLCRLFFYNHIDFITQESTVPDLRRNVINDKAEPPRHYFDMENYGAVETFPKTMEEAKAKYDEKF